jgi:hypothetical protein
MYSPGSSAYCKYYQSQAGGSAAFPVFVGGQHGEGLGSLFRSVLRYIAPVAMRGITHFASNTLQKHGQGQSLVDAARSSVGPALGTMASGLVSKPSQSGSGSFSEKQSVSPLFDGVNGIPHGVKRAYKGAVPKAKKNTAKKRKLDHTGYNF